MNLLNDPSFIGAAINAGLALALALGVALIVRGLVRSGGGVEYAFALVIAIVIAMLAISNWRNFSNHGLMHFSIVYALFERGIPPELPLVAGEKLRYFYAFHLLVAQMMGWIGLAPPWFFAALNFFSIVGFVVVMDRIARYFSRDSAYRVVVIVLSLFGFNLLVGGPLGLFFNRLLEWPFLPQLDIFHKFFTINNNQLGVLFFCLSFLGSLRLVGRCEGRSPYIQITSGYLGIGVFYPPLLPSFALLMAATIAHMVFLTKPRRIKEGAVVALISIIGGVLLLPWILSIATGKAGTGAIQALSFSKLPKDLMILTAFMILPLAIAFFGRQVLSGFLAEHRDTGRYLVVLLGFLLSGFLLAVGSHSADLENKILMLSQIPLALLLGMPLVAIVRSARFGGLALLALLFVPVTFKMVPVILSGWPVSDPVHTEGPYMIHEVANERDLYDWLANKTTKDAVVVDSYLTVPVFARRSLYIGLDDRDVPWGVSDGWGPARTIVDTTNGVDPDLSERRRYLAREILRDTTEPLDELLVGEVASSLDGRPLYVISRSETSRRRLKETRGALQLVFENDAAAIFAMAAGSAKGSGS